MEFLKSYIDFFLHLDKNLAMFIQTYGTFTYVLLFMTIFAETGLIVIPLLPGDSLLFAAGAFAAAGALDVRTLIVLLTIAAITGDTLNYWIGHFVGPKVFHENRKYLFKKEYLDRAHVFYEKYGGKTIIFARFIPIVRTFAPFVAGVARMKYGNFLLYNVIGGVVWIMLFTTAGYYFGNIPAVHKNFSLVILVIIFISILPGVFEFLRSRALHKKKNSEVPTDISNT